MRPSEFIQLELEVRGMCPLFYQKEQERRMHFAHEPHPHGELCPTSISMNRLPLLPTPSHLGSPGQGQLFPLGRQAVPRPYVPQLSVRNSGQAPQQVGLSVPSKVYPQALSHPY